VDVLERGDDVVFLHAVVEGGADRAYGVHVARLAGVPERVTRRAALLLQALESQRGVPLAGPDASANPCRGACAELVAMDVLRMSPLQAQAELLRLQQAAQTSFVGPGALRPPTQSR
jgi:DNA mismatch repair protein MutS